MMGTCQMTGIKGKTNQAMGHDDQAPKSKMARRLVSCREIRLFRPLPETHPVLISLEIKRVSANISVCFGISNLMFFIGSVWKQWACLFRVKGRMARRDEALSMVPWRITFGSTED